MRGHRVEESKAGRKSWVRSRTDLPGFGLFSVGEALGMGLGRPPTERRPNREYGRKPNILLTPGWDNLASSSSLSKKCH